jgi:hypothetical protein
MRQVRYERELAATREVLGTAEVAGYPKPSFELSELHRLIERYPEQAREYLEELRPPKPREPGQG